VAHSARAGVGLLVLLALSLSLFASRGAAQAPDTAARPTKKPWYERLNLRGYAQLRYNDLFLSNKALRCEQCDRAIGGTEEFSVRRARLVVSGDVGDWVSVYIQPDLAQSSGTAEFFLQMRDLYADVYATRSKTLRFRPGLSKVPFGWENLQSSSNRLPLDRVDAMNSATPGERELGLFVYWAPTATRKLFRTLVDSGLKGTGDYGVVGFGVYNGQGATRAEANGNKHVVARLTYPFQAGRKQIVEVGVQGYTGLYHVLTSQVTAGVAGGDADYRDHRLGLSAVLYPQPLGLAAEWNWGDGPEYDPALNAIREQALEGGYVQASWRTFVHGHPFIPFVRAQYYDGGKRQEQDARSYHVEELELGIEYAPVSALEMTAAFTVSDRRFEDGGAPVNHQKGEFVRLQAQLNY
jgi:hypothetical protein